MHVVERHRTPYPLPRAVHLDDEVFRVLQAAGVADEVLARSRPMAGLRLLDGRHRILAEFRRSPDAGLHGWPQGSFVHQPDLEAVLSSAADADPGITVERGVEVTALRSDAVGVTLTLTPATVVRTVPSAHPRSSVATAPTAPSAR